MSINWAKYRKLGFISYILNTYLIFIPCIKNIFTIVNVSFMRKNKSILKQNNCLMSNIFSQSEYSLSDDYLIF